MVMVKLMFSRSPNAESVSRNFSSASLERSSRILLRSSMKKWVMSQAAQEAEQHRVAADAVIVGADQPRLIGDIIGQMPALFDADNIALFLFNGFADERDQGLGLAGAGQTHDEFNHRKSPHL